jgi:hypothetical protein
MGGYGPRRQHGMDQCPGEHVSRSRDHLVGLHRCLVLWPVATEKMVSPSEMPWRGGLRRRDLGAPRRRADTTSTGATRPENNDHPNLTNSATERTKPTPVSFYAPASSMDSSTNTSTRHDVQR